MKVLALNGSPRMRASATFHLLTHLLEGMRRAGPEELALAMAEMYNAAALPGLRVTIQLHFVDSPDDPDWFVAIDDDRCKARRGTTPFPTMRIYTPTAVWASIGGGELDAAQAFTDGKFEVDGQLELLSLLPRILTYPRRA